tara:strand:- start:1509 stop:1946 length:438 start_codon:yes stop_codon:yes gene_type:complete
MSDKIKNIIEPLLEQGHFLMEITYDPRGNFLRIIIDSEDDLTLNDTAKLTRTIKRLSENDSGIPDGVRIEVSTPGLDYSLSEPFQYRKNLNRNLAVVYDENKSLTKFTGKIINANDKSFQLESGKKTLSLFYDQVKSALVKVSFK